MTEVNLILSENEENTLNFIIDSADMTIINMMLRYSQENITKQILQDIAEIKKQIKESREVY